LILPYFHLVTPVSLLANLVVVPLAFFVLAVGLMSLLVAPIAPWITLVFNNANWSLASAILASVGVFARAPAGHFYVERPHWPTGARAEMTALDVGPGAAIHLRNRGADWLIDCGPERNFKRIVRSYLRFRGTNALTASPSRTATRCTSAPRHQCCARFARRSSSTHQCRTARAFTRH
jgi:hypothetical protein